MDCIRVALSSSKYHESQQADQAPSGFRRIWSPPLNNPMRFTSEINWKFLLRQKPSPSDSSWILQFRLKNTDVKRIEIYKLSTSLRFLDLRPSGFNPLNFPLNRPEITSPTRLPQYKIIWKSASWPSPSGFKSTFCCLTISESTETKSKISASSNFRQAPKGV